MLTFQEGDVVKTIFEPGDKQRKVRPAIVLRKVRNGHVEDFLCCAVTSQLYREVEGLDDVIRRGDDDFEASGLIVDSLIRTAFLGYYADEDLEGRIGRISPERHAKLLVQLARWTCASTHCLPE